MVVDNRFVVVVVVVDNVFVVVVVVAIDVLQMLACCLLNCHLEVFPSLTEVSEICVLVSLNFLLLGGHGCSYQCDVAC